MRRSAVYAVLALCLIATMSWAEVDPEAQAVLRDIRLGRNTPNQIQTLRVETSVILPAGSIEDADLADGISADKVEWTVATLASVTNGQPVTLEWGQINALKAINGAENGTNTITIVDAAADDVGKMTWLFNNAAATNALRIAKTGNFYGATIVLLPGESMAIFAGTTNVLYGK